MWMCGGECVCKCKYRRPHWSNKNKNRNGHNNNNSNGNKLAEKKYHDCNLIMALETKMLEY